MELQRNSVVWVTGGASGLGAAACRLFAQKGMRVALIDMNEETGEKIANQIGATFFQCDVSSNASVESAAAQITAELGKPRVLLNCAGIATPAKIIGKKGLMPMEHFEKLIRINLIGSFNMMRLATEQMMTLDADGDGQRGVIISTASVAAYEGQIGQTAYSASKGGIVGLTLPAARELAPFGIRVNAIAPGVFLTPLMAAMSEEVQQSLAATIPNPSRLGHPDEFAQLAWHIIENNYINGTTIRLDGALRMQPK
ncbi:MAG: SDR family NAD(P)-dependent oxidoreductase [Bacteroidetes bacterium]|nr:SDR family NAD(P)-dependent oxidoreductase [Bacteroidota bacterium]